MTTTLEPATTFLAAVREILEFVLGDGAEGTAAGDEEVDLRLDSFALVDVLEALERRFALRVAPADATQENFGTVARIARFVASRLPS